MKYKVGDKVKMTQRLNGHGIPIGHYAIITRVQKSDQENYFYEGKEVDQRLIWAFDDNECKSVIKISNNIKTI